MPMRPRRNAPYLRSFNIANLTVTSYKLVYLTDAGTVDLADASDINKMPAIGMVVSVTPGGVAAVAREWILETTGLEPGARYVVSDTTPGDFIKDALLSLNSVMQQVGVAELSTSMSVIVGTEFVQPYM